MLNTKKRQKQAEAARGGRGRRHEARGEFPQHADDDDKQNNNNSGSKATEKKQEQERATFRPAAKTITKAGGATCCCCYCCCHKPQHNIVVKCMQHITESCIKAQRNITPNSREGEMVGKGEGATSSAAVRGIRSLFAACYNCCCFSSPHSFFPSSCSCNKI